MSTINISSDFAKQIVDSTKTVVEKDINFISTDGFIIASTDAIRIGEFHEVGYNVIKNLEVGEVTEDNIYKGSKKGINYPIVVNDEVVGVIGITGNPEEVSKYGFLLTKISEIFIKEYLLELNVQDHKQRMTKLLLALIYNNYEEGLEELLVNYDIEQTTKYSVVQIIVNKENIHMKSLEKEIVKDMEVTGFKLYTYIYPNELLFLINEKQYKNFIKNLDNLETRYGSISSIGIGLLEDLHSSHISYQFSKIAIKHSLENNRFFTIAENMNIELLIGSLNERIRNQYYKKLLGKLDVEEINLLKAYFKNDMSLKLTSNELFIHKNTLQYRLTTIKNKIGLDPRKFKNAVAIYLAIRMNCYV